MPVPADRVALSEHHARARCARRPRHAPLPLLRQLGLVEAAERIRLLRRAQLVRDVDDFDFVLRVRREFRLSPRRRRVEVLVVGRPAASRRVSTVR